VAGGDRGDAKALDQLLDVIEQRMAIPPPLDNSADRAARANEAATKKETEKLARTRRRSRPRRCSSHERSTTTPATQADVARELRISMTQLRGLAGTRIEEETPTLRSRRAAWSSHRSRGSRS
jgi:hypothetical protein